MRRGNQVNRTGKGAGTRKLAWALSAVILAGIPSISFAKHVGYDGEIGRARVELVETDRNWKHSLEELNRARMTLDASKARHAQIAAGIDNLERDAHRARHELDSAQAAMRIAQTDYGRTQVLVGELVRRAQDGEARVAGARQYVETVRARLIFDFENGRELRYALADVTNAQARLDQARNAVAGYVEGSPSVRWLRSEERRIAEEIGYFSRMRPVDRRRIEAAERAIADIRRDIEEQVNRALSQDLAVREAGVALNAAQARVDHLRQCFERDLPRHRDLAAAHANVGREEHALNCTRAELADAERRLAAIKCEVDKHAACVAEASHRAHCADETLAKARQELHCTRDAIAAAEIHVKRVTEIECAAHTARDRAASRVAFLERRVDDGGRGDRWAGRDDDRRGRDDRGNHYGRDRKDDRADRDDRIGRIGGGFRDGRNVWADVRFDRR